MGGEHRVDEGKDALGIDTELRDQKLGGFALAHRADDKADLEIGDALERLAHREAVAHRPVQRGRQIGESNDRLAPRREPGAHLIAAAVGADHHEAVEREQVVQRTGPRKRRGNTEIHRVGPIGTRLEPSEIMVTKALPKRLGIRTQTSRK
jgi:hypothetical protein